MINFKAEVANVLAEKIKDLTEAQIYEMIETPPNSDLGDYAFPCFRLAKSFRKAPNIIAQDLVAEIEQDELLSDIKNTGPYVNFFINKKTYVKTVLNEVFEKKENFGKSKMGEGKKVIVEFSSPNIAKPFHIGHIRSTVIGNAIYKIHEFLGYDTVTINHLGDYGTQFGKLIVAYKKWGNKEEVEKEPINTLLKLYVHFHEEAETKPELEDEARLMFKRLENGDEEATSLWKWFRDVSLVEFNRVYNMLNIKFDSYAGESFYSDKMGKIIDAMEEKKLLKQSEGADVVELEEYDMPPALIRKSDGSTLYITRDIAAAIYRKEHYDFYKNIYVVASQQNLHFQQWFKVLDIMGYDWSKDCVHVPFGLVSLESGTMSTRKGRVVFLEDVLKQAVDKTREIVKAKNGEMENLEEVAQQVGIGAVIFQELSNGRIKDYTFSWDKILNFDGETGPYIQYTHARACSVLRKTEVEISNDVDFDCLTSPEAVTLIKAIHNFPDVIIDAGKKYEPSIITRQVINIAQAFNKFYHDVHIIVEDQEIQQARVLLVYATKQVIQNGLALLGMQAPEKM